MVPARQQSVVVVSDGRGETAQTVLRAALVQFAGHQLRVRVEREVRSVERVAAIVEAAAHAQAVILYTLVEHATRRALAERATQLLVPIVDVLGPSLSALHDLLQREPTAQPGLLYASEREDFERHVAIDYTLEHDDGRRPDELDQAEVVLVGVSRTAKSSTCFYLAYHGIKAANVPLLPDLPPPPQLCALDPQKVVGLCINPMRLLVVRQARAGHLGLRAGSDYLDRHAIARELRAAQRLMAQRGWRRFDASYMAVEEIARTIMRMIGRPTSELS